MKVTVIPIVIGALGTTLKCLVKVLGMLEISGREENVQSTAIVDLGQNTEKSPRDLKKLAVAYTPVKDH